MRRWPEALLLAVASLGAQAEPSAVRWLALGDSYTIGEAVDPEGRWPVQLAARLREHGLVVDAPHLVARTGWTTDELSAAMDAAALEPGWGLVSLAIGVNNQYRGRTTDEYRAQFEGLLRRAITLAGGRPGRVLVLSIPDWGVTPFAAKSGRDLARIADEIDAFNAQAAAVCRAHGVAFVDVTADSRGPGAHADLLADDGLHPSAAQYALWAERALPVALRLLEVR
jgi:lysophospholipase L1-like esterase